MTDPRGPIRTIKAVEFTPSVQLITYQECDHTGQGVTHMTFKVGSQSRCFECGAEATP